MWQVFGLKYYSLGEECKVKHPTYFPNELFSLVKRSLIVILILTISKILANWIYAGYAREYALQECGGNESDPKLEETAKKYREEGWKSKVTSLITLFGFYVMTTSEIAELDVWNWPKDYPQKNSNLIDVYYQIALGYHSFRTVNQIFEPRRKDYFAMMFHHWVTLFLILFSYLIGVTQTGILVMLCHDNGDALLSWGKILTYCKWHRCRDAVFVTFMIMWVLSRIVAYSILVLIPYVLATDYSCQAGYYAFGPPLFALLCLHIYWFRQIIQIAHARVVVGPTAQDIRSDEEAFHKSYKAKKH